jgi:hypothetical protein
MKLWILILTLNGKNFTYDYKFYYKKTCDTIGKSFINKRKTNTFRCKNIKI